MEGVAGLAAVLLTDWPQPGSGPGEAQGVEADVEADKLSGEAGE